MSDYEEELERNISLLQEKLQESLERQERINKSANADLYDVKALLGKMCDVLSKLRRMDEVDYSDSEGNIISPNYKKDKKEIEKQLVAIHDSLHDRVINLLDRFKE
jgi:hypothetical protein